MSKKFKYQASSARAASSFSAFSAFQSSSSPLSYITEYPDLSQISNANIVVSLKNLSKKDSTTKAKALEDLLSSCQNDPEDALLVAWAEIYPRTSIDNSRRVRQLAHTLQGALTTSAGKRIASVLPKVIPTWLAATFDGDKIVVKSASEALEKAFNTSEKRKALWSIYKIPIHEYVDGCILKETVQTLSDERTTSLDDAQAKYVRVVGTALRLLASLIQETSFRAEILADKALWDFVHHDDAYLRRAACSLGRVASENQPDQLDWPVLSTSFISKGIHSAQNGSAQSFTETLLQLTKARPTFWIDDYTAKTTAGKRLLQLLKRGSQEGPEDVWRNLGGLLRTVPPQTWFSGTMESCTTLIDAIKAGVLLERLNFAAAWFFYLQTCFWLLDEFLQATNDRTILAERYLCPLVLEYVTKKRSSSEWVVKNDVAVKLSAAIIAGTLKRDMLPAFQSMWNQSVEETRQAMRLSQPATSKDFTSSQEAVIKQAERLYGIPAVIATTDESLAARVKERSHSSDVQLLHDSIDLLKSRNGKPFSAAGIIVLLVRQTGKDDRYLQDFLNHDLSSLLDSPSGDRLVAASHECDKSVMQLLLQAKLTPNTVRGLQYVLRQSTEDGLVGSEEQIYERTADLKDDFSRTLTLTIMSNPGLQKLQTRIAEHLLTAVSSSDDEMQDAAIAVLDKCLSQPQSQKALSNGQSRAQLLARLLLISESDSSKSVQASILVSKLRDNSEDASTSIIQQQFNGEGEPLSVLTLLDLAREALRTADINSILPSEGQWQSALKPHLQQKCAPELSITSPLQGTSWLLGSTSPTTSGIVGDVDEFSTLFRLTYYVTKLIDREARRHLGRQQSITVYRYLPIALQLVNEKLTLDTANEIWLDSTTEVVQEASEVLSDGNLQILSWIDDEEFQNIWLASAHQAGADTRQAYLEALAFTQIASFYIDRQGPGRILSEYADDLRSIHRSQHVVWSAALIQASRDFFIPTQDGKRLCNELIAMATKSPDDLTTLVLLNILLSSEGTTTAFVPQQRMVFLLKALIHGLSNHTNVGLQTETLKLLAGILPSMKEIYGEHWDDVLKNVSTILSTQAVEDLVLMHACLKLVVGLKKLVSEDDVNEDLKEAWLSARSELNAVLIDSLHTLSTSTSTINQPRSITARLVGRLLSDVQLETDTDMYSLISASEEEVQSTAYNLLHQAIPRQQEQLSLELALEQKLPRLPQRLTDSVLETQDTRRYLLSWKLVFDHFENASYRLQEAYAAEIRNNCRIEGLLERICDIVHITSGRAIDASKFHITEYELSAAETARKDEQWLAVHLYYNALLRLPSLVKDWFIQQKNRVKSPLESWTQKHFSPLTVAASLETVTNWSATQSQDEEDRPIQIKSSARASEVVASIAIDPESPPIALVVSFPSAYPLESPMVLSKTRVGVSEKNWTSWLRTFQIIMFSSGSIIEGLVAFRRNVMGALKGQSECAICYSIIGTDMQTPNKKCGTCKNTFHGVCLFKWFKNSNSSSCPLCRNNFNYA